MTDDDLMAAEMELLARCEDASWDHFYRQGRNGRKPLAPLDGAGRGPVGLGFKLTGDQQKNRELLGRLVFYVAHEAINMRANYGLSRWVKRPAIVRTERGIEARLELAPPNV